MVLRESVRISCIQRRHSNRLSRVCWWGVGSTENGCVCCVGTPSSSVGAIFSGRWRQERCVENVLDQWQVTTSKWRNDSLKSCEFFKL